MFAHQVLKRVAQLGGTWARGAQRGMASASTRVLQPSSNKAGLIKDLNTIRAMQIEIPMRSLATESSTAQTQSTKPTTVDPSSIPGFTSPRVPAQNKMSVMFTLPNSAGALSKALEAFTHFGVNMTRVESKPCLRSNDYEFHIDFEGTPQQPNVVALIAKLRELANQVNVLESRKVPWFPRRKKDLDAIANEILDAGAELEADHPGFHDPVYRRRRQQQAEIALNYKYGDKIPRIEYTKEEVECWGQVYSKLRPLHEKYGCREHVRLLPLFEQNVGYSATNIPQLQDISDFLMDCTGFSLRPVAGLLSARNFLYGLAFRTFFSTQYLRHHSKPLYTPEPDIVHELMGHAILFADQDFADFSQQIGLAAIGATDEQILALSRVYWFSVEFGLTKQDGKLKAYGAGLLSSYGELEYAMGLNAEKPELCEWDPFEAAKQDYPITTYQPKYYVAESFEDAKKSMTKFSETLKKPFHVKYCPNSCTIDIDANVELTKEEKKAGRLSYDSFAHE